MVWQIARASIAIVSHTNLNILRAQLVARPTCAVVALSRSF
jgi:uncharacterized membrane-anchored protein